MSVIIATKSLINVNYISCKHPMEYKIDHFQFELINFFLTILLLNFIQSQSVLFYLKHFASMQITIINHFIWFKQIWKPFEIVSRAFIIIIFLELLSSSSSFNRLTYFSWQSFNQYKFKAEYLETQPFQKLPSNKQCDGNSTFHLHIDDVFRLFFNGKMRKFENIFHLYINFVYLLYAFVSFVSCLCCSIGIFLHCEVENYAGKSMGGEALYSELTKSHQCSRKK